MTLTFADWRNQIGSSQSTEYDIINTNMSLRRGTTWGLQDRCGTANGWDEELGTPSQYACFRCNETDDGRKPTALLLRMSGHTGELTGWLQPAPCFPLTVDFVSAFCLRYDLRSMVFQSGSNALLENVMLDRDYRGGLCSIGDMLGNS